MLRDFLNIKKLKKQEQNSSRDEKLNKNLLHRKNKNKNRAEKRLKRASKMKKYQLEKTGEIFRKKRIRIALLIVTSVFLALIIRVAWIQFHNGDSLQQMAYLQQTLDRKINPKRGTIYDATGKTVLATSSSVETITINPVNISKENKEKVARKLAEVFELVYEKFLKMVNKKKQIPVTLFTGYLGAGNTTLLNHVLANQEGYKVAVIVNDIGEVIIDASLIAKGGNVTQKDENLVPLSNGCICCTLKVDLMKQIIQLATSGRFDYILIEASGICEPGPIAGSICMLDGTDPRSDFFAV